MVEHRPHFRFKNTTKNPICKRFFAKTFQKPISLLEDKTFCAVKTKKRIRLYPNPLLESWKQNLQSICDYMMASLIFSTMYLTSSSLTYGPLGRHMPTLNKDSETPLTYAGASL